MKVLIADDHPLVRDAISHALHRLDGEITVVDATDFATAIDMLNETEDLNLVIADLTMPGMDRFTGLRRIVAGAGDVPVVVFSSCEDIEDIRSALHCGIRGYIPKSSTSAVLLSSLKLVLSGGSCVPLDLVDNNRSLPSALPHVGSILTRRQHEVVALLSKGKSNKEIANDLGLSPGTVRTHVEAIFKALNVTNRTQASHVARDLGLLEV